MGTWEIVPDPEEGDLDPSVSREIEQGGADMTRIINAWSEERGIGRTERAFRLAQTIATVALAFVRDGASLDRIAFLIENTTDGSDPLYAIVQDSMAEMVRKLARAIAD